jgi:hypothetical protein
VTNPGVFQTASERTHCKWGHEYTPENTRWEKPKAKRSAVRICETCRLKRMQEKREARAKAKATPIRETTDPAVLLCREEWAKRSHRLMPR